MVEGCQQGPGRLCWPKEYLAAAGMNRRQGVRRSVQASPVETSGHEGLLMAEAVAAAHPDDEVEQQKFLREMIKSGKN